MSETYNVLIANFGLWHLSDLSHTADTISLRCTTNIILKIKKKQQKKSYVVANQQISKWATETTHFHVKLAGLSSI